MLFHVEIAVMDVQFQGALAVLGIDKGCGSFHHLLLLLELFHIMVADNIGKAALLHLAVHLHQHDKAFVAGGMLGALGSGQQRIELHSDQLGVHHLVLGCTGMDIETMDNNLGTGCIEVFVLHFAHGTAVHSICIIGTKAGDVEFIRTSAHLFVGGEADLQSSVAHLGGEEHLRACHDLGNTCLIVRAQQGGAISDDQMLAVVVAKALIVLLLHEDALFLIEKHIAAVVLHDFGLDIGTRGIGRGIHMGNQSNGGQAGITGNGAVNIAIFIHVGICNAHLEHFLYQSCAQQFLLGSGGAGLGLLVRLGVKGHIFQKTIYYRGHFLFSFFVNLFFATKPATAAMAAGTSHSSASTQSQIQKGAEVKLCLYC